MNLYSSLNIVIKDSKIHNKKVNKAQKTVREHIWLSPSKRCSRYKKESLKKKRRKKELNKIIHCLYIIVQPPGILCCYIPCLSSFLASIRFIHPLLASIRFIHYCCICSYLDFRLLLTSSGFIHSCPCFWSLQDLTVDFIGPWWIPKVVVLAISQTHNFSGFVQESP